MAVDVNSHPQWQIAAGNTVQGQYYLMTVLASAAAPAEKSPANIGNMLLYFVSMMLNAGVQKLVVSHHF